MNHLSQGWNRIKSALPTMSTTAKCIAVTIITVNIASFVLSAFRSWSGLIPILAGLGGEIAFFGLWLEEEADEEDKKEHLSNVLDEKFRNRLKAKIGWWILMLAITLEVLTSIGLAGYDVAENIATTKHIADADPLNQPVSSISAVVSFNVREVTFSENPVWGNPTRIATTFFCESNLWIGNELVSMSMFTPLDAATFTNFGDKNEPKYVMHFNTPTFWI
jgi:hypothetical protein